MKDQPTLRSLFDARKSELEQKLDGMTLPKDNQKIQQIISEHFAILFDSDGEFRQSLTQAEDYLLQASLSLLTAQQEMSKTFINQKIRANTIRDDIKDAAFENAIGKAPSKKSYQEYLGLTMPVLHAGVGVTSGALIGQMAFGGWGAVCGAIAGTAVMAYIAGRKFPEKSEGSKNGTEIKVRPEIVNDTLDVKGFVCVVGNICESLDNLISTFRAQVNKVIDKYESMEKPSIEKEYRILLENIQTLIGYKRTHSSDDEKFIKKLQLRIEDLAECLENYNLTLVDYDGSNERLFDFVPSPETSEIKMAFPAVVKDGVAVIKGKIFTPANNN